MDANHISEMTGIPAELLTGKDASENLQKAEALLKFKREYNLQRDKSKVEQFGELFSDMAGDERVDQTQIDAGILQTLQGELDVNLGRYPSVRDGGEVRNLQTRTSFEAFGEWLDNNL